MFERFTHAARDVVRSAYDEAEALGHRQVGTQHLLLGLLREEAGVAYAVLRDAGMSGERVRAEIERLVGSRSGILSDEDAAALKTIGIDLDTVLSRIEESLGPVSQLPAPPAAGGGLFGRRRGSGRFGPRARKVLELALREAIRLRHNYIGPEHILLGILREGDGLAAKILTAAGLTLDDLRRQVLAGLDKAA
ncbi:MAG: Clp protease [Dactylosporangium sp.]|nr:Clp protease [Dactylosporangium sp.]